jgi:hypothetical protein
LAGQWELPLWENPIQEDQSTKSFLETLSKRFSLTGPVRHGITRYDYRVYGVDAGLWGQEPLPKDHFFWKPGELEPGVVTTLTKKLLNAEPALIL